MKHVWFTICANNYLGYALTLYQSLRRNHPEADFILFLADEKSDAVDYSTFPFEVISANALPISSFSDMSFRYDIMELATAIKPSCFKWLFKERRYEFATYLDPDIYVTSSLEKVIESLEDGHEAVLTPHITTPYTDQYHPDALQISRAGTYNLGFAAFSKSDQSTLFLNWWDQQLRKDGHNDLARGTFVDQKYAEFIPSFIQKTKILHDLGYNAAYWNLHERPITQREDRWYAGEHSLAFFHFSGVVPGHPKVFSKHQNRYSVEDIGILRDLLNTYLDELANNDQPFYKNIQYAYDTLDSGEVISPIMRKTYAIYASDEEAEAFCSSEQKVCPDKLFARLHPEFKLPILLVEAWKARPDLQKAFNLHDHSGCSGYMAWFASNGARTFNLPEKLITKLLTASPETSQSPRKNIIAQAATTILNAAPSLRPLYKHIPLNVRSAAKTALYRSHQHGGSSSGQLLLSDAGGDIDQNKTPGIHFYGYVRSQSGIGQGARGLCTALKNQNLPIAIKALSNPNDPREAFPFPEIAAPTRGYRTCLINANAEQILSFEELANPRHLDNTYRIAYWVWELGTFPQAFLPAIEKIDEIWVPSTFVADSLKSVTDKPVHVLPYAVTPEDPAALTRHHFNLPTHRTVFLTAFDVNSFLKRKNPTAAIQAFIDAFDHESPNAPVLAIKVHGNKGHSDARTILQEHIGDAPNIIIIDQTLKRDEYLALHFQSDVFVSLHRSEGFGLNLAEAMLIGKPVIATDWSGNRDFMTKENSIPVSHTLIDVPRGAYPHWEGQQWADPSHDEAVRAMQKLAFDRKTRETLGKEAHQTISELYNEAKTGLAIRRRLEEIDPELADSKDKY